MVSTLMHLVWSTTFSKMLHIKNAVRFLFFGILLDFDFILDFFWKRPTDHRDYFHNIFFVLLLLSALWVWNRRKRDDELLKSAAPALSLHIFLDFFDGAGVPLFFPLFPERILLYSIGHTYVFPLKLVWEGNFCFSSASFLIMLAALYRHRTRAISKASQT